MKKQSFFTRQSPAVRFFTIVDFLTKQNGGVGVRWHSATGGNGAILCVQPEARECPK
jgi:hypothetical protein